MQYTVTGQSTGMCSWPANLQLPELLPVASLAFAWSYVQADPTNLNVGSV